ncbi:hypothetical protein [Leucobacter aridicollis]|uniref:Bacterial EndoU nuclease domain-containing protein n=1 Tax=Leucobacter aridicollis TaxID=283878 RepID=A0A852QUZ6_9MICO|nr:hypothetical protein [Leucobacter aridicollis]NYD26093.1 hypothetical protein [Leucobacter aridicollis]
MGAVDRLNAAQRAAAGLAKADLQKVWRLYSHLPADKLRDTLFTALPALAQKHGDIMSAAAADWYEETLRESTGQSRRALLSGVNLEAVEKAARWAVDDLYHGDPVDTWRKLEKSLLRHVKNAGRNTVRLNAERDGFSYARVPSGKTTCAFCLMMASRGFSYSSRGAAGETASGFGDRFHDDCDCSVVPHYALSRRERAEFDQRVEDMYGMYEAARKEVRADGFDATDRAIAQRIRDMFPGDIKDGAEVPSILRDLDSGWPEGVKPVPGRKWRHILKRHGPGGDAPSLFPDEMTEYEIAKIVRETMQAPDYTAPHPERPGTTLNYFKTIAGQKYVVGTYLDGDGKLTIATSFPVSGNGGIL